MKIIRNVNGQEVEFELTKDEVYSAYIEQEYEFDCAAAKRGLVKVDNESVDEVNEMYGLDLAHNDVFIGLVAEEMRRNIDKYGVDFEFARDEAIPVALKEFEKDLVSGEGGAEWRKKYLDGLKAWFEEKDFSVDWYEQHDRDGICGVQLERWTSGGVDMLPFLDLRDEGKSVYCLEDVKAEVASYAEDFDVDETIDRHREDPRYRKDFMITESVKDFTEFKGILEGMAEAIADVSVKEILGVEYKPTEKSRLGDLMQAAENAKGVQRGEMDKDKSVNGLDR